MLVCRRQDLPAIADDERKYYVTHAEVLSDNGRIVDERIPARFKGEFIETEKEKIEHLLEMAREKGVLFAIQVAKKMNEPFLLDTLHDALAREGYYQKFMKK